MPHLTELKKEDFENLAHAYFEPGNKTYWDGIEFAKSFWVTFLDQELSRQVEDIKGDIENVKCEPGDVVTGYVVPFSDILSLPSLNPNHTKE